MWLILISWGCLTSPTFVSFCNELHFDWPVAKHVNTIFLTPKHRRFYWMMKFLPLGPTWMGAKGRTLGKTYGINERCYREHLGSTLGTLGTGWKVTLSNNSASRLVTLIQESIIAEQIKNSYKFHHSFQIASSNRIIFKSKTEFSVC